MRNFGHDLSVEADPDRGDRHTWDAEFEGFLEYCGQAARLRDMNQRTSKRVVPAAGTGCIGTTLPGDIVKWV